jgi:diguanylate cyclase (GGDEF)-like protein/PAS domain S-box-containing protein
MRFKSLSDQIHQNDAGFLERKLEEHFSNIRTGAIGNLINVAVTLLLFRSLLTFVSAALVLGTLAGIVAWRFALSRKLEAFRGKRLHLLLLDNRVSVTAIMVGGFWGAVIAVFFTMASPIQQVYLGILSAGMMGAGTATFRTCGRAANYYVLGMIPGCVAGFAALPFEVFLGGTGLLASYVVFLFRTSSVAAESYRTAYYREQELARSNDTIKLLLNDYSEQGANCLFEIDESGTLRDVPARLLEMSGKEESELSGKRLIDLIDESADKTRLSSVLAMGKPFKDHVVSFTRDNAVHWWSISARPMSDGRGGYRGVIADVTAQRQAEQRVSFLAHHDTLTLLPNRFQFNHMLTAALWQSRVTGIMFLDLDQFKSVNDTMGHPVGDALLQAVARKLESCTTQDEVVARLGGDEFAIIVRGERTQKIDDISDAILTALSEPIELDNQSIVIGTSIGVALSSDGNLRADELLRNADLALYAAKANGRNRMVRFVAGMDEAAQYRRDLETDMRTALVNGEMVLHYQPLIDVKTGVTTGHEALLRWEHPVRGRIMPDIFIPVAEETGLIVQLGEWVIRQAVSDAARGQNQMTMSINLSPAQMRSPTLLPTLINALASNQVDAGRICFEITETVLMHDNEANLETLHKLRDIGVQIALDDFGTGYSSLNYLRSFPFHKIKIDRCFLNEIEDREDCQAIVRSVVHLARSLGMSTTAEGVEREDQMALLREEGCTEAQGFLFSKAVPIGDLPEMQEVRVILDAPLPEPLPQAREPDQKRAA